MCRNHHVLAATPLAGGPGKKVGVVGIGGLGHMGIKLAHAMGAHVVAFTTSESKREAAKPWGPMKLLTHAMPMRWWLM